MDGVDLDTARLLVGYMAGKELRLLAPLTLYQVDDLTSPALELRPGDILHLNPVQHVPRNDPDASVHLTSPAGPVRLSLVEFAQAFCLNG